MADSDSKATILIADDDLAVRVLTQAVLRRLRYDVRLACNGLDALEALQTVEVDVLLTDLLMPGLSGFELIERVRANTHLNYLSIIVLATEPKRHLPRIRPEHITNAIIKPFDLDVFLRMLDDAVEKARKARPKIARQ